MKEVEAIKYSPSEVVECINRQSGVRVIHEEFIYQLDVYSSGRLRLLVPLCPLYAQSDLSESELVSGDYVSIEDSRVASKWTAIQSLVENLSVKLGEMGIDLEVNFVFANRGVLIGHDVDFNDSLALQQHQQEYFARSCALAENLGFDFTFTNYDYYGVQVKRFVKVAKDETAEIPTDPDEMLVMINSFLEETGIPSLVVINKKSRRIVGNLIKVLGPENAFQVIVGYLSFDWMIPEIIGDNGVYVSIERLGYLFRIAALTKDLEDKPRIEITA